MFYSFLHDLKKVSTGKVYNILLKVLVVTHAWGAFVKLLAGWLIVYYGAKFHETAKLRQCARDLEYHTLFLGFLFFSAIAEFMTIMAFLVAADRGSWCGETHLERITREMAAKEELRKEKAKVDKEMKSGDKRRKSSYAPDTSKEHEELIRKVSSSVGRTESKKKI